MLITRSLTLSQFTCVFFSLTIGVCSVGCSWTRIGSLTMASTRNVESKIEYKLIAKNVEGISNLNQDNAFQEAIDNAVKQYQDAEFMKNVIIYIKSNGKKIKVEGDVWGTPSVLKNITQTVVATIHYSTGDRVAFKNKQGKIIEGNIIGINNNSALVEYNNGRSTVKDIVNFNSLTKIQIATDKTKIRANTTTTTLLRNDTSTTSAKSEEKLYKTTKSIILNIEASVFSKSVCKIPMGESVLLIEETKPQWWKIKYENQVGFVQSKYLSK